MKSSSGKTWQRSMVRFRVGAVGLFATVCLTLGCLDLEPETPVEEQPPVTFERSMLDGFDALIEEARVHYGVPGAVVTVIYGDHPVFSSGFGERAKSASQPLTEDTLFRLGTLTRPISTSLVATLVDEQRLDWQGDLPDGLSPALVERLRGQDEKLEALGGRVTEAITDTVPRDGLSDTTTERFEFLVLNAQAFDECRR